MGEVTVTKVIVNHQMIGDFTLIMPAGKHFENDSLVEIYSRQIDMFFTRIKPEKKLKESEEKYRSLIEGSSDAIFCVDDKGQYQFTNHLFAATFGKTPDDFIGKTFWDVYQKEHADLRFEIIKRVFQTRQSHSFEIEVPTAGKTLYFYSTANPIIDETGQVKEVLIYAADITERKRANAELEALLEVMQGLASTKDLHEILAIIHHSIAKVIYAENFFVVFYNKDSGLFEEVYSVDKYDPPAPPSRLEKSITAYIYRSGKPQNMTQALFNELEAKGEVEMVGTNSASWLGAPLITSDGTIGVIVVQDYETSDRYGERDINFLANIGSQVAFVIERKRTEEALRESDRKYKLLHESAGAGIGYYSPDGKVISFNLLAASYMGGKPEDFAGKSVYELFPPLAADIYMERIRKAAAFEETQEYEDPVDLPGERKWFVSAYNRILDSSNQVIGVQIISTDISKIKQAEEQIQQLNAELELRVADRTVQLTAANLELEAFSYSVSHDLRAPLRALEGFSAVLGSDYRDQLDEQGQHYLARIQEASRRMGQLIEDLLKLSRITRVDIIRQRVDLSELAKRIAAELAGQSPEREVRFDIQADMMLQGDENLLKIALENLLSNAYKFTSRCEHAFIQVGSDHARWKSNSFLCVITAPGSIWSTLTNSLALSNACTM